MTLSKRSCLLLTKMDKKIVAKIFPLDRQKLACFCGYKGEHVLFKRQVCTKKIRDRECAVRFETNSCPACHYIVASKRVLDGCIVPNVPTPQG